MNHYPSNVKEKLNSIILSMAEHHWLFSKNPGHDFTRQHLGKLSFYDTMRLIISMGKGSTNDEIMDYFDLDDGEGYISLNGKNFVNVKEKKDCNLCIKAFTRD